MFKFNGLDKLNKDLNKLSENAKRLDGSHDVSFEELFPNDFMSKNTNFSNMQKFLDDFDPRMTNESFVDVQKTKEWESYVESNSRFESWDDMLGTATEEYASKKLFDGI